VGDALARPQPPVLGPGRQAPVGGKVYGSSGSLPNFVKTDKATGEILVWPYIEQTLTPTPANPYATVVPAKAIDHFDRLASASRPPCAGSSPTSTARRLTYVLTCLASGGESGGDPRGR
jgi:hypothetical protein